MSKQGLEFGPDYREIIRLKKGRTVILRQVRAGDKPLFRRAIAEYSPESFYRRFLVAKPRLTDQELRYLTEFDGYDHWALCAVEPMTEGGRGLAVARFVRQEIQPTLAEFAIYVGDPVQKKGLGVLMMHRLAKAALERGVHTFVGEALPSNEPIVKLAQKLDSKAQIRRLDRRIEITLSVPKVAKD